MKIFNNLVENKNLSLALGFFDGIHIAHRQLIQTAIQKAQENNIKSAVLTFKQSPASIILKKEPVYLFSKEDKIYQLENLGLDYLYILDFNDFKNMTAEDYLNNIILKYFAPEFIVTGFNHTFGLNRKGNSDFLNNCKSFKHIQIKPVCISDTLVSSTNIKKEIEKGNITFANKMLGRNFSYTGKVIKGAQIARQLGYKTANLIWTKNIVKPKYGVYLGSVTLNDIKHKALINFGIRPTIDKDLKEMLEVHILDFEDNLYGQTIKVEFLSKLRDEIKFSSFNELKTQIEKDYKIIQSYSI